MAEEHALGSRLINLAVSMFVIYVVSVPFYMKFENFSFIDAIYFVSVTIATVGYGDIVPVTPLGRLFTILLIFSGISTLFYYITDLGRFKEKSIDGYVKDRVNLLRNLADTSPDEKTEEIRKRIRKRMAKEAKRKEKEGESES
ncbi:two pore domain potassium channel family protein [Candidatus Micrarchaeota archaeon]|nr:two pore domain potassium channel family protein [Candidatus Micrarchaeota archaeon]